MLKKLYSGVLFIIGGIVGGTLYYLVQNIFHDGYSGTRLIRSNADFSMLVLSVIIFGLIFLVLAPAISKTGKRTTISIGKDLEGVPGRKIAAAVIGLIAGLVIALLLSMSYRSVLSSGWYAVLTLLLYIICGYLGFAVAISKCRDGADPRGGWMDGILPRSHGTAKVIDTSVIIDARILDIMRAGFVEGRLIIPDFVLDELRHIADSADSLKRVRGRRGLDVLNTIREEFEVEVYSTVKVKSLEDIPEVDVKLIKLAKELGAKLLTTDFNLNKAATINEIKVLNVNDLANAIKPVVIPGEHMIVGVVKQGKDPSQGIGYLDDGTMIVVEDGKDYIGETIDVAVTSVIQTSAGKMIFGKRVHAPRR